MKTKSHAFIVLIVSSVLFLGCLNSLRAENAAAIHVVKRGDTLYSLARRYNSSVDLIMQANSIRNPRDLRVGMKLTIPKEVTSSLARRAKQEALEDNRQSNHTPSEAAVATDGLRFSYPLNGRLLSRFGRRKYSRRSRRSHFHAGVDIKGRIGDAIRASEAGVVIFSGRKRGYGKIVKILHAGGFSTVYAHNSVNLAAKGQRVVKGQIIARVGMTGHTTGSHVHFEIRYKNRALNPLKYLGKTVVLRSR